MKINEVEAAVGITKKNIRFYEEEGLIAPGREPGNGYRSYSQADVERLQRIKLLRKLDVPLADIREMLAGQKTLAEGMAQQLERLSTRRKDLDEAIGFCELLHGEPGTLEELDVQQTLARLTAREEQGVTFVNIERTDRKAERIRGACIGAALFVALMAFVIAILVWAFYTDPQDAPPLPLLIVLFGIPAGCIVGTLKVLIDRIEEIGKGEEDAYRNY
jgi:DNA-binding transcriptional MerR regulator